MTLKLILSYLAKAFSILLYSLSCVLLFQDLNNLNLIPESIELDFFFETSVPDDVVDTELEELLLLSKLDIKPYLDFLSGCLEIVVVVEVVVAFVVTVIAGVGGVTEVGWYEAEEELSGIGGSSVESIFLKSESKFKAVSVEFFSGSFMVSLGLLVIFSLSAIDKDLSLSFKFCMTKDTKPFFYNQKNSFIERCDI